MRTPIMLALLASTEAAAAPSFELGVPHTLYLNRCIGGCSIIKGDREDARTHTSSLAGMSGTIDEFPFSPQTWDAFVSCMKKVWSPYDVEIVDTLPAAEVHYAEAIVGGTPQQIGVFETAGVAPMDGMCRSIEYPISYTFAATPSFVNAPDRAGRLCAIATQEAAHAYGLDHLFTFVDGSTSCSDAMTSTFRECGIKYFRNVGGKCGEMTERPCRCGPVQNTHLAMTQRLGVGSPTTIATASITSPVEGPIENGATIVATASADRGVVEVTFRLNGYTWKTLPGAPLNAAGQLATPYEFQLPTDVPDGVIDIEVEAVDDLGASAKATVTVTKGAPCATEDTCATGQSCDAGRCIWPAPIGNVGDECTYAQFCLEPRCDTHDGESRCTRACVPGLAGACELGLECIDDPAGAYCWPVADGTGCCSSSHELPWGALMLGGCVVFLVGRRRGRRR